MNRLCSLLAIISVMASQVGAAHAQAPSAGPLPVPRTIKAAWADPLAAPARVRDFATMLGLPPVGRGQLSTAMRMALPRYARGQYNVCFRPAATTRARAWLNSRAHARVLGTIPHLGIETVAASDQDVASYRKDPNVAWVEPNPMRYPLVAAPNDPAYSNIDTNVVIDPLNATWFKWDAHLIQCVEGWTIWPGQYYTSSGKGAAAVKLAIIDTGIDYGHPDFVNAGGTTSDVTGGGQLYRSLDRTMYLGTTTTDAWDVFGHGTHVAGIAAAATNNALGTTGNGYNAQVISLRVTDATGNGTASDLARAIVYAADAGAVVCNISLGDYGYSRAEQDAVKYAWAKGMLVVAAAGNDGSMVPPPLIYPAALSRVLSVSATAKDDSLASYSSWGDWVGVAAPGGDLDMTTLSIFGIYSTTPTYTVTINGPDYGVAMNYDYLEGTSMASPQVAGLAALYAGFKGITQSTPNGPLRIWRAIQQGAEGIGGWNAFYGFGRINVFNTMNLDTVPNPRVDTVGAIAGQVRYKGTPVLNADIAAVPTGGGVEVSAASRSDGGYRLPNLAAGTYDVTARYFGEAQTYHAVTVVDGSDTPGIDFNVSVISISGLSANPNPAVGGNVVTGTVSAPGPAPSGGLLVTVSSSNPALANPTVSSLIIPAGSTSATFPISTAASAANTPVGLTAITDGTAVTTTLTVGPRLASRVWVPNATGAVGQGLLLNAYLLRLSDKSPIAGRTLSISVDGSLVASGTTDVNGRFQAPYTIPAGAGPHTVTAAFADATDTMYTTSSGSGTLSVTQKTATRVWVPNIGGTAGTNVLVRGYLLIAGTSTYVPGKLLTFTIDGNPIGQGTTDSIGRVQFWFPIPVGWTGAKTIVAAFSDAADPTYGTSSSSGTLTIQ